MSDKKHAPLCEAAQNALITLDGIASANPRDKADFETPDEWIAWAKSRARFSADALREPISREVYAERILRQMLHDASQATQEPVQAGELPPLPEPEISGIPLGMPMSIGNYIRPSKDLFTADQMHAYARAALAARKPAVPMTDELVIAVARCLCKLHAEGRGVNEHDAWTHYSDDFKAEALKVLQAINGIGLEVKP